MASCRTARRISIELPRDLNFRLHEIAATHGCTAQQLILRSIETAVAATPRQRPKKRLNLDEPFVPPTGKPINPLRRTDLPRRVPIREHSYPNFPDTNVRLAFSTLNMGAPICFRRPRDASFDLTGNFESFQKYFSIQSRRDSGNFASSRR